MLITAQDSTLLVVDAQERLAPAVAGKDACLARIRLLATAAQALDVPIVVSQQYPRGLGATVPELAEALERATTFSKLHFSCAADPAMVAHVAGLGRRTLLVTGMEAHICVLQSALGFLGQGYRVAVVADAVGSRRAESRELALRRVAGAGAQVVDAEMVVFEWMHVAGTPAFKRLIGLIK